MSRPDVRRFSILGAGSWATAIAQLLASKEWVEGVLLWTRRDEVAHGVNSLRSNPRYLSDVPLSPKIRATTSLEELVTYSNFVMLAVPVQAMREVLSGLNRLRRSPLFLCNLSKGIEVSSGMTVSSLVFSSLDPAVGPVIYSVLSGPSHAEEVVRGYPTAVVVACEDQEVASWWQVLLSGESFRAYTSQDVLGVELCGAFKNVLAIGAGMLDGLRAGDNAKASFLTRGLAEMRRFVLRMGGTSETLLGLAGVGDLMVTCYSRHSRNRRFGELLGLGYKPEEALAEISMAVEGYPTLRALNAASQAFGVEMPIVKSLYEIIYEGRELLPALRGLMSRPLKQEHYC